MIHMYTKVYLRKIDMHECLGLSANIPNVTHFSWHLFSNVEMTKAITNGNVYTRI